MAAVDSDSLIARPTEQRPIETLLSGFTYFSDGDVLVAKITPCFENGKIAEVQLSSEHGFGSTEFHVLRAKAGHLHPRYLTHFLRQPSVRHAGERRMTGSAGQRRVPRDFLKELAIPLPPLQEQRRIAAILDKADALRQKRRAALQKLDSLTQSLFLDMFGDPATNPKRLSVRPLGDALKFITSGGRGWAEYYSTAGSRFIRSLDVRMNYVSDDDAAFVSPPDSAEARRTRVQADDVLLTITGSRIGRVSKVTPALEGSFISQHVCILRLDPTKLNPDFLSFFLSLETGGQRQIAASQYGQTKPGLNFDQIRRFRIPSPSLSLQREFVSRISAVDRLRFSLNTASVEAEALGVSAQHRAFRGEL